MSNILTAENFHCRIKERIKFKHTRLDNALTHACNLKSDVVISSILAKHEMYDLFNEMLDNELLELKLEAEHLKEGQEDA